MNFVDIIIKKRNNFPLSTNEINFFIDGIINNTIPDYQTSAMLMAIYFNSLNSVETADLTDAMTKSGNVFDLSDIPSIKVDKHSTGGVADTTTLVLLPLIASCGVPIIKMSGKGLGHTGGTIDKLNAIPNFNTDISFERAKKLLKLNNAVIMSQTKDIAPADKILYALRDVTGTVESIPLIAASIMSKKLAVGCDAIVLDVKCGNGAFMHDLNSARELAQIMVDIGKRLNKKVIAVITDMNKPLGKNIGNSFEVIEAIEILKGNIEGDLKEVSIELGSYMLVLANKCKNIETAKEILNNNIKNGKGIEMLERIIYSQNGNADILNNYSLLPHSEECIQLKAKEAGYLYSIDTYEVGKASIEIGAGRHKKTDSIDYGSGIILNKSIGDSVKKGDVIAQIYSQTLSKCNVALEKLDNAIEVKSEKPPKTNIILDIIK